MENPDRVTLLALDREFHCQKSFLRERSSYFRAMFSRSFIEHNKDVVRLKDVDPEGLEPLLDPDFDFLTAEDPLSILNVACMLQFDSAIEICLTYIKDTWLTSKNCLRTMMFANRLSMPELKKRAKSVALCEFNQVKNNEEYLYLSIEDMENYLDDNTLNVRTGEYEVFTFIKRWIYFNNVSDERQIYILISTIRLRDLTLPQLLQIQHHNFITGKSLSLLKYAIGQLDVIRPRGRSAVFRRSVEFDKDSKHLTRSKITDSEVTRQGELVLSKIRVLSTAPCIVASRCSIVIDGESEWEEKDPHLYAWNGQSLVSLLSLDKATGPDVAVGCRMICVDLTIFILGGEFMARSQGVWNMTVWAYEFPMEKWRLETTLPKQRRHHSVVNIDNDIYLIGGVGKHRIILKTISKYNIVTKNWSECSILPRPIHSAACCVHEGNIYIVDMDIIVYKPRENRTEILSVALPEKIGIKCAMSYKSWIYLVGSNAPKLYRFDPAGKTQKIQNVGSFMFVGTNACKSNDKIYQFSEVDEVLYVEYFDLVNSTFNMSFRKNIKDCGISFDLSAGCFPLLNYLLNGLE